MPRYQLIEPIISNKIYDTTSLKRASKRCFNEVKNLKYNNLTTFTIQNLDSNETFTFKIHKPPHKLDNINEVNENILNLSYLIDVNNKNTNANNTNTNSNANVNANEINMDTNLKKEINEKNIIKLIVEDIKDIKSRINKIENKIDADKNINKCNIS